MFEDSELPDFDSMSQEELIEWLEQLAKSHGAAASEFIDDYDYDSEEVDEKDSSQDDDWSDWLDDTAPGEATMESDENFRADAGLAPYDADPPVDLSLFDDEDTAPTATLDWLDEIIAAQNAAELPDFSNMRTAAQSSGNPHNLPGGDDEDDPLDWLNELDTNGIASGSNRAADDLDFPDDFDETWEDDETLDDLEDESLYSTGADNSASFLESLPGLEDREAEGHSTQSMAPVPDSELVAPPEIAETVTVASADRADSLSSAFLVQDREADLEAWYAERLRAISAPEEAAPLPEPVKPGKPPPPGLAAAINSARGKVKADRLPDAILDYETLLGTTAGLQWVVFDMRELIAQEKFRDNPSVHRVLGDAYMRQGQLDAALNVYRHALSLL